MPRPERPLRFRGPEGHALSGVLRPAEASPEAGAAEGAGASGEANVEAPGPAVLFAPGNGFPVQAYGPALAGLPPDVTVHALDPRSLGPAAAAAAGNGAALARLSDWGALLADLRAYVEQRMQPPVILAGHSMGAMLALRLAAEAPALVAGLLLLEPPLRVRRGQPLSPEAAAGGRAFVERTRGRRAAWAAREEAAAWFAGSVSYRLWHAEARAAFVAHGLVAAPQGGVRLATPPELEAALYETVPRQELFAWAARARCAGVLLRGRESAAADVAALEELADALPVGVVIPVPGSHAFPMEHPAETGLRMAAALRLLRGETGLALTPVESGRTG